MKPIERRKSIVQGGMDQFETFAFSIDVNAKSFRILIDKLYTDKISAVIRELSTNALDSHVQAGKADVPFDVTLPTPSKPFFIVRDIGVGLDHEACTNLYTTLFRSTNENTNETMGQLGLGSKSPFAYATSFTVDAYMDGRCRTYFASLADGGIPTISLLSDVESDEPTGFKVSVPVQEKDFADFHEKAKLIYFGFDIKPNGVEPNDYEPLMSGDFWRVYSRRGAVNTQGRQGFNPNGPLSGHLYVRQGSVIYPVSLDDVRSFVNTDLYPNSKKSLIPDDPQTEFDSKEQFTFKDRAYLRIPEADIRRRNSLHLLPENSTLVLDVPIGTVEVAPSREALSMDEFTREFVRAAYLEAVGEIGKKIRADIIGITNHYDASHFAANLSNIVQVKNNNFGWQYVPKGKGYYTAGLIQKILGTFNLVDIESVCGTYCGYDTKISVTMKELHPTSDGWNRAPSRPKVLVIRDDKPMLRRKLRLRRFLSGGVAYKTIVMHNPSNKDLEKITRRLRLTNADFIQDYMLKDYPPDPKPVVTPEQAKIAKAKSTRGIYLIQSDSTIDSPSRIEDNHLWIAFVKGASNAYNVGPTGSEFPRHTVARFYHTLYNYGNGDDYGYVGEKHRPLYGVGPSRISDFDPEKNAYVAMRELLATFDWANIRRSHAFVDAFGRNFNHQIVKDLYEHVFGAEMQLMQDRLSNYFQPHTYHNAYGGEKAFYDLLYDTQPVAKRGEEEFNMMQELRDKYPLLFARSDASMEVIKTYTKFVDKKRAK